jgi:hypothetical protein
MMAGFLMIVGFMLTFGAVGGMDSVPVWEPNPYFLEQVALALLGLFMMLIGAIFLDTKEQDHD